MKKMKHYLILFAALLVSGGAWGTVVVSNLTDLQTALTGSDDDITLNATISISATTSLDLNGKTITSTVARAFNISGSSAITLTLQNGTINATREGSDTYIVYMANNSYLVLTDIILSSTCAPIYNYRGKTITLNSNVTLQGGTYEIHNKATNTYPITISNSGSNTIQKVYNEAKASMTISNSGTLTIGNLSAAVANTSVTVTNTGTLQVLGGVFTSATYNAIQNYVPSGYTAYDYAVPATSASALGKLVAATGSVTMKASISSNQYINLATAALKATTNQVINLLEDDEYSGTLSIPNAVTINMQGNTFSLLTNTSQIVPSANLTIDGENGTIESAGYGIGYTTGFSGKTLFIKNLTINCTGPRQCLSVSGTTTASAVASSIILDNVSLNTNNASYVLYVNSANVAVTLKNSCSFSGQNPIISCSRVGLSVNNQGICNTLAVVETNDVAITNSGTLTLSGGSYKKDITIQNTGTLSVTGGVYATKSTTEDSLAYKAIKIYIASGYTAGDATIGSGSSAVAAKEISQSAGEASFNGATYSTLKGAIEAAQSSALDNPTVTLLQTVEGEHVVLNKSMTLDIGEFDITFNDLSDCFYVREGTFTITGTGKIENTATGTETNKSFAITLHDYNPSLSIDGITIKGKDCAVQVNKANSITIGSGATVINGVRTTGSTNYQCNSITNNSNNCDVYFERTYVENIVNTGSGSVTLSYLCQYPSTASLSSFVEVGRTLFLQHDVLYGDVYLVESGDRSVLAKVGDYEFQDTNLGLSKAISASSELTPAILQADFSFPSFGSSLSATGYLDLNGYTLTVTDPAGFVLHEDNLTILDSSAEHTGKIVSTNSSDNSTVFSMSTGTLTIKGGTIGDGTSKFGIRGVQESTSSVTIDGANANVIGRDYGVFVEEGCTFTLNNGTITSNGHGVLNNGSITTPTTMNINGGAINAAQHGIYHAGPGTLNITGGSIIGGLTGVEIRAGNLNMSGGEVISTYERDEEETTPWGNGPTTMGVGIAVMQHTTEKAISVNISDGDVTGLLPIKLGNPQNNPEASIDMVNVSINEEKGGRYKVTNGASTDFWSVTDNFIVYAGKFSHVPSYVAPGKTVIANTDTDKVVYPYIIGVVSLTTNDAQGIGNIVWEIDNDWKLNGESTQAIPVSTDNVTVAAGQNVIVTGKEEGTGDETDGAFAYSIEIAQGGSLVVDSGAVLVVGGGGITNNNIDNSGILVKNGGTLLISPDATDAHPYGGVQLKTVTAKHGKDSEGWVDRDHRFQLIGIPTMDQPTIIRGDAGSGHGQSIYLNTWDINNGWQSVTSLAQFNTPFKGYSFWNDAVDTLFLFNPSEKAALKDSVDHDVLYTFKGNLVGNQQNLMQFQQDGYHFFANSYTAPIDIYSLLGGAENGVQKAVYILLPMEYRYEAVDYAKLKVQAYTYRTIAPMEGFFFLKKTEGTGTAPIDYITTVWSPSFPGGATPNAMVAARKQSESDMTSVRVSLTDDIIHRCDNVYLMASDKYSAQEDASDTRKMMNPAKGVNIYAPSNLGNLSTMQTGDLDGQYLAITTNAATSYTLSFDWVKGDVLYLTDHVTGQTTPMLEGNTYTFSADPNAAIADRFEIVRIIPGVVTNVVNVVEPTKNIHGIYTLMGQYVGESFDWNQLPNGVYVVNGQKVVK